MEKIYHTYPETPLSVFISLEENPDCQHIFEEHFFKDKIFEEMFKQAKLIHMTWKQSHGRIIEFDFFGKISKQERRVENE